MYDLDSPNGKQSSNNIYIHYIKIENDTLIEYNPPTPPRGVHRYVIKRLKLNTEQLTKLRNIIHPNRKSEVYQIIKHHNIFGINYEAKQFKSRIQFSCK